MQVKAALWLGPILFNDQEKFVDAGMDELAPRERSQDINALLGLDAAPRSRLKRWAKPALAALAAGALGVAALAWFFAAGTAGATRYVTQAAARGDLTVVVTATGSVQPTTKVDVSSELSGIVRRVLVDYNSQVKTGQALAELDTDKLQATVESSRAKLNAAKARIGEIDITIRETEREHTRKKSLAEKDFSSARDLDVAWALHQRALASLASAKADAIAAEADLRFNETNLAKARIVSPIDGVVLKRNVDPGQTVASSLQAPVLFSIAEDLRKMEAQVDVDEADVGKVREGQAATFTVDAYADRKFPATIRELRYASETVQGVVTYKAVLTVDNSELLLRPGMTATAEITVEQVKGALLVPNAALRFSPPAQSPQQSQSFLRRLMPGLPQFRAPSQRQDHGSARRVWVLANDEPQAVPVAAGASDGKMTEILKGEIQSGQALIVDAVAAKRQ